MWDGWLTIFDGITIQVDPDYLETLEHRYREISGSLRSVSGAAGRFHQAPEVENAYREFQDRWNQTREEVAVGIDRIADALRETRLSFVEADQALQQSLADGASS